MVRARFLLPLLVCLALAGVAAAEKKVVVLVAYPGAGKSELGKVLGQRARAKGWVSSDVIREEVARRGLEPIPANLSLVGKEMQRREPGGVGRLIASKIAASRGQRHFVDGLRTVEDVRALRRLFPNARLVKLDVSADLRHQRMLARGRLGETTLEVLRARDAADEGLGVGDLMRMDPETSFLLRPADGLPALREAATPVVKHLTGR